jgi:hypothetical protein
MTNIEYLQQNLEEGKRLTRERYACLRMAFSINMPEPLRNVFPETCDDFHGFNPESNSATIPLDPDNMDLSIWNPVFVTFAYDEVEGWKFKEYAVLVPGAGGFQSTKTLTAAMVIADGAKKMMEMRGRMQGAQGSRILQ